MNNQTLTNSTSCIYATYIITNKLFPIVHIAHFINEPNQLEYFHEDNFIKQLNSNIVQQIPNIKFKNMKQ